MATTLRRAAGRLKRAVLPSPEEAAWRRACHVAERVPRRQAGEIDLAGLSIGYTDLLSVCPQWRDFFVLHRLRFASPTPSPRILDCGANVGLASLYYKRLYPQARITAYEADPAIAAVARRNMSANGVPDVEVRNAAVWIDAAGVSFQADGADGGAVAGTGSGLAGETVRVPAVRLRDELERDHVDLLKMDIEGAEEAVLADCEPVLDRVDALMLDVHDFDAHSRRLPGILTLLERAGFTYALSNLMELPWRSVAPDGTPFERSASAWAIAVRGWRER